MTPNLFTSIGQIFVNVHDLPKAITFYRDTLSMKFLFEVPSMAFFDCGGIRVMLGIAESPEFDHPASVIYYKTESIQFTYERLSERGVDFMSKPHRVATMPDHELWMAFFKDPDKNVLALMSEVRT